MAETTLAQVMRQIEPSMIFIAASDYVGEGTIYSISNHGVYDIVCHSSCAVALAHELSKSFAVRLLDAQEFEQRGVLWTITSGLMPKSEH